MTDLPLTHWIEQGWWWWCWWWWFFGGWGVGRCSGGVDLTLLSVYPAFTAMVVGLYLWKATRHTFPITDSKDDIYEQYHCYGMKGDKVSRWSAKFALWKILQDTDCWYTVTVKMQNAVIGYLFSSTHKLNHEHQLISDQSVDTCAIQKLRCCDWRAEQSIALLIPWVKEAQSRLLTTTSLHKTNSLTHSLIKKDKTDSEIAEKSDNKKIF